MVFAALGFMAVSPALAQDDCNEQVVARVRVNPGHPWRPPFGLERVGRPLTAVVEITSEHPPLREYFLAGYREGKETERHLLHLSYESPHTDTTSFDVYPNEIALLAKCTYRGDPVEIARETVTAPAFEADAIAKPDRLINPVDLGTVLIPADWLLLLKGERATAEVAVVDNARDVSDVRAVAWFESMPRQKVAANLRLERGRRADLKLVLPPITTNISDDVLHVEVLAADSKELWRKLIRTMLVNEPPRWPRFGATEAELRYDAPISVRDPKTGTLSSMKYVGAWAPELKDVVVSLPNGARFVFWRGSSYVPFWAGPHNTGFTYEWAETSPPPEGFSDSVEPLMDKELRYGRVAILESTPARVHVRWTYQSCDFTYKVWGDSAAEDFYFYPDGFGTRVVNLKSAMGSDYELSEFIILTPAAAYPLEVLPQKAVEILFVDGLRRDVSLPFYVEGETKPLAWPDYMAEKVRGMPAVYRVRMHKDDTATAVYFNPLDPHLPPYPFAPFYDRGQMVTPAYWGSHWPLARGKTTGGSIDDRIYVSPSHNSIMSWGRSRPTPNRTARIEDIDTLGRSKTMTVESWVWLIGMTDTSDEHLLDWARSFSRPPSVELKGAHLDFNSYVPERRAIRLVAEDQTVEITLTPTVKCVNPVFELEDAPRNLASVTLGSRPLVEAMEYVWDGHTLWLNAAIEQPTTLRLRFSKASH